MILVGNLLKFHSQVILGDSLEEKSPKNKFGCLVVLIEACFIATKQVRCVFDEAKTGIFSIIFIIVAHKLLEV
jgi:hypothetical protein